MGLLSGLSFGFSSAQVTLGAVLIVASYYVIYAVYNIFFSPIAHIPGPLFAKFSGLPSFYHTVTGSRHIWIWQCHQIYGPTVRIGPNAAIFQNPQAYRDIYGAKSNVQRSKNYEFWQRNGLDVNTLNTSDVALHHKKRRNLNLVFTEKSVRAAGVFINEHVNRWGDLLMGSESGEWSPPRNMSDWTDYLVFDILCDLCFGRSLNIKEPEDNKFKGIPKAIHAYLTFTYPFTRSPILGTLLWLKPRGLNQLMDWITPPDVKSYYEFLEQSVKARRQSEEESQNEGKQLRQDMFHFLFQAKDPETGGPAYTSEEELFAEANLLVIAGSDTTSINMSAFFFYIVRNPAAYAKLIHEIRTTFQSVEDIKAGSQLSSCAYLAACIDEMMRMTPAGPGELSRTILPGGQTIDGHFYPEGVTVGAAGWATGHNDEYGDPNVFRPERWIVDEKNGNTAAEVKRIAGLVHPFSAGWGNCAGQNLAKLELLTTVARTLYRFDVRSEPGSTLGEGSLELGWGRREKKAFQLYDSYVAMRDGPMVQFRKATTTTTSSTTT